MTLLELKKTIERWGRGIKLILSKEPTTVFKEIGTHFITVFKRNNLAEATPQATPQVVSKDLTVLELKIVSLIRKNRYVSRAAIADRLHMSANTIKEYIKRLRNRNIIRRKGPQVVIGLSFRLVLLSLNAEREVIK